MTKSGRKVEEKTTEFRAAKASLEASELRYRELVDLAPIGIFRSTLEGRFVSVNPALASLLGYDSTDEMLQLDLRTDVYFDSAERDRRLSERESTGMSGFEVRWKRRDGSAVWVRVDSRVIRGDSGAIELFEGFVHDIQERKDAEEALRRSEGRYRILFEKNPESMWVYDLSTLAFLAVNDTAVRTYGYSAEEFLSMTIKDIRPEEDVARLLEMVAAVKGGYADTRDWRHRRKDGSLIDVEIASQPLEFSGRQARLVLAKDATERKRAEESIQKLLLAVEQAENVIFMTDPDGAITYANPAFEAVYGFPPEETLGRTPRILKSGRYDEAFYEGYWRTLLAGESMRGEVVNKRRDGQLVTVEGFVSSVLNPEGRRIGFIAVQHDVTQKKRLEEQFRQAQKMEAIGQLAGGVAHDFNNVLTAILGYGSLLASRLASDAAGREEVEEILRAGGRAATLTRQLLAFSRRQVLEPVVLPLNELVMNLERMLARLIGEDVGLVTHLEPSLGNVLADAGQIEQVLMNLVVNARDAMPQGGKLTIETANADLDESSAQRHATIQPGRYVMVAVSDTGTGMDAETQARIFEPFFTTKEKGKGTGLGLSTVYGIVKQSGGNIWVYSESGKGSTFKVYLPRVEDVAAEGVPRPADPLPAAGTGTILLVEDEESVRTLARRILEKQGYRVLEAPNGREAEKLVTANPEKIDVLLTDLVMPNMPGTELATRLCAKRPGLRVVLMSGYTEDAAVRNGLPGSGRVFLQKPFTPAMLVRKMRDVLA